MMTLTDQEKRAALACHEARHAVLAVAFDLPLLTLSLRPAGCRVLDDGLPCEERVLTALAGLVDDGALWLGADDMDIAEAEYRRMGALRPFHAALEDLKARTRRALYDYENEIRRIAQDLVRRTTMTAAQVESQVLGTTRARLRQASPPRHPETHTTWRRIPTPRLRPPQQQCENPFRRHTTVAEGWGFIDIAGRNTRVCLGCMQVHYAG
jgi:hypothetical protein